MIRVLIVDDEPLARQGVRDLLAGDPGVEIVGECADGPEALETIRSGRPDIVFLDVQMPELDGFGVLEALEPGEIPLVIFVTAYDEYALRAFDVHALDYLLKPIDEERFREAFGRAKQQLGASDRGDTLERIFRVLRDTRGARAGAERLMIRSQGRVAFVRVADIDWIEAQGDYVALHCQGKKNLLRTSLNDLEVRLAQHAFVRIHRSTMVHANRIKEMQPLFHGDYTVVLLDGTRLTMSRSYREKVFERMGVLR
jgi:two-component system LytT family response regulator